MFVQIKNKKLKFSFLYFLKIDPFCRLLNIFHYFYLESESLPITLECILGWEAIIGLPKGILAFFIHYFMSLCMFFRFRAKAEIRS